MIRILLAHDEPSLRRHLTRLLDEAGHSVVAVDRGTRALPLLADDVFDVLVTDMVLPEMDGVELAQRCCTISPMTRIVYLNGFSAVALERSRRRQEPPACGKPFHVRRLATEIERLLAPSLEATTGIGGASRLPAR
jgi:two-component system cell cycle response regulator CpdR